jgi:hypothetical protein
MSVERYDNDLVEVFHERVVKSLVHVECTNPKTGSKTCGTATVIGHGGNNEEGFIPYLVTAGHVLPDPRSNSIVRLTRFKFDDPAHPTSRTAEFSLPIECPGNKGPGFIRLEDKYLKDRVDLGLIRAPTYCTDNEPWFKCDNPSTEAMPIEAANQWSAEGTEVAWAGFSELVMQIARRPQPCFYRGVVSAMIIRDIFQMYLIDGHNMLGISGGPVWSINSETNSPKLIAIVSSYRYNEVLPAIPGFVCAMPIQVLMSTISSDYTIQSMLT